MKEYIPAIDDVDLRKNNTEIVVNSIDNIGKYFKEIKHMNRVNFFVGLGSAGLILIICIGVMFAAFTVENEEGFMDNLIDKGAMARRFNCSAQDSSLIFRTVAEAESFKNIFPEGECIFWDTRDINNEST